MEILTSSSEFVHDEGIHQPAPKRVETQGHRSKQEDLPFVPKQVPRDRIDRGRWMDLELREKDSCFFLLFAMRFRSDVTTCLERSLSLRCVNVR